MYTVYVIVLFRSGLFSTNEQMSSQLTADGCKPVGDFIQADRFKNLRNNMSQKQVKVRRGMNRLSKVKAKKQHLQTVKNQISAIKKRLGFQKEKKIISLFTDPILEHVQVTCEPFFTSFTFPRLKSRTGTECSNE